MDVYGFGLLALQFKVLSWNGSWFIFLYFMLIPIHVLLSTTSKRKRKFYITWNKNKMIIEQQLINLWFNRPWTGQTMKNNNLLQVH